MTMQSGIPSRWIPDSGTLRSQGLLLRGVVTATYVVDDANHPRKDDEPVAIYCDVLCYSGPVSVRWRFLPGVLVSQDLGALHRGQIWKPRATTMDITGDTLDLNQASNPAAWDGDHVLVGFLDDSLNMPVILRGIPHPSADVGNEAKTVGHRMKLKVADGDPNFWKHHGAFFGVADNGDWQVDTSYAYDGKLPTPDGKEPPTVPTDGRGSHLHTLPKNATFKIRLVDADGTTQVAELTLSATELKQVFANAAADLLLQIGTGATLKVEGKDATAKLTLGDGSAHVAIAEQLQTWWGTVQTEFIRWAPLVEAALNSLGFPITPPLVVPAYSSTITSTKVRIPDL